MDEDFYIKLIYKQIAGEISGEEQKLLEGWKSASPENSLVVEAVQKAWELSATSPEMPSVDLDQEFSLLEKKINEEKPGEPNREKIRPLRRRWMSIAAAFLILIIAAFALRTFLFDGTSAQLVEFHSENVQQTITLSDESMVTLNKNSQLKYPEQFNRKTRKVYLSGEAFFEIKRDVNRPFRIETSKEEITVLGTSFNVRAIEDEEKITVFVAEGKVRLQLIGQAEHVILEKGEEGTSDRTTGKVTKKLEPNENQLSWRTKLLNFDETPISSVLQTLEQSYDVKFIIDDLTVKDCPFTSRFDNEELDIILQTIAAVLELEIEKINSDTLRLKGGNCQ